DLFLEQIVSGDGRERLSDGAAREQHAGQLAAEQDRAGDEIEAEVALVDDGAASAARELELVAGELERLVAALEALLGVQGEAAELVVGRGDAAVGVIEDVAGGVGEGELEVPPAADDPLEHLD